MVLNSFYILFIFKKVTDTTYLKDDNGLHTLV